MQAQKDDISSYYDELSSANESGRKKLNRGPVRQRINEGDHEVSRNLSSSEDEILERVELDKKQSILLEQLSPSILRALDSASNDKLTGTETETDSPEKLDDDYYAESDAGDREGKVGRISQALEKME